MKSVRPAQLNLIQKVSKASGLKFGVLYHVTLEHLKTDVFTKTIKNCNGVDWKWLVYQKSAWTFFSPICINLLTHTPIYNYFLYYSAVIPIIQRLCFITFALFLRWNISRKQSFRFWFTMLFDHSWKKISPQKLLMRPSNIRYLFLLIVYFAHLT